METLRRPDESGWFAAPVVSALRGLTFVTRDLTPFDRRSAEAPKRRSAEAPKRRSAEAPKRRSESCVRDPRPRRLLLAALIAGALCALHATPAAARSTVWSATLNVDSVTGSQEHGCSNTTAHDDCSDPNALSDDDFNYRGTTYAVKFFVWHDGANQLFLAFDDLTGAEAKTALGPLTLKVDGREYAVSDAQTTRNALEWSFTRGWRDGHRVSLELTTRRVVDGVTLDKFRAIPGDDKIELRWNKLSSGSCGYQISWRKSGSTGAWQDYTFYTIGGTRFTISHLTPGTSYEVHLHVKLAESTKKAFELTVSTTGSTSGMQQQQQPEAVEPPPGDQGQPDPPAEPPDNGQQAQRNAPEAVEPPGDTPSEPDPDAPVTRTGTDGADVLKGAGGDDLLMGRKGRDVLRGKGGHDELRGGSGHDELFGGTGDDELFGGKGDDTFRGGPGADRFVFSPRDTGDKIITDFDAGEGDRIVLQTNRQVSIADIVAGGVAQGTQYYVYTLFPDLTVETHVPLRTEDFVVE